MVIGAVPSFKRYTVDAGLGVGGVVTGWLAKVKGVGVKKAVGAVPSPDKATVAGIELPPPVMLNEMFIGEVRSPAAEGVKLTVMVQVPLPAGRLLPMQVSVSPNSGTSGIEMELMVAV